jgi:ABC-type antimicrobial peptide transport system permease subunit
MALGAAPRAVAATVLREAILLTGLGMAIGLPLALILGHLIRGELFGVGLFDPPSIGLAMIALGLSGAVAAYLPATRAMRVAPLEAIHTE